MADVGVGRIVHICLEPDNFQRERLDAYRFDAFCRPAIVVRSWGNQHGTEGAINAVMLFDGSNDSHELAVLGERSFDEHTHVIEHGAIPDEEPSSTLERVTKRMPHAAMPARVMKLAAWRTSCPPNRAVKIPGSWHWPRECRSVPLPQLFLIPEEDRKMYHIHREGLSDPDHCPACQAQAIWLAKRAGQE